ncbi:MAG: PAS domain S-box protein [Methanomassiliicoccales archaeon]|nr:PAS domain S-box protein [Methanomassiliicoccales archaeon]
MDRPLIALLAGCIVILIIGGYFGHAEMEEQDDGMRGYLLINSKVAATAIDIDDIRALNGTSDDLNRSEYQDVRSILEKQRAAVPIARFVYLLGQHPNGSYFFYVDAEPSNSSDYSPPGQLYETPSVWIDEAFQGMAVTGGPVTDEWGKWMSCLVPIIDEDTGEVVAVMGMDVDVDEWEHQKIEAGIPSIVISATAIAMMAVFYVLHKRKRDENKKLFEAKEELRESSEKYRTLIENSHDTIFIIQDWKVVFVSPSIERTLGISQQEMQDRPVSEFIPQEDMIRIQDSVRTLDDNAGSIEIGRVHVHHKDDPREAIVLLTVSKIDYHGKRAYMGTMHDTTARENAETALSEANRKLQLMTGITRHDILNQLTIMRGRLELAKRAKDPASAKDWEDKAMQSADNIESMIAFTKDYQDIGMNAPVWHELSDVVRKAANGMTEMKVVDLLPKSEVLADPLFVKVFHNLIDNAMRHGKAAKVEFSATVEDGALLIMVEDDGVGIEEKDRARMFDRGYGKHTGMGLFFSREVLQMTGITINDSSGPGKGARFVLKVPEEKWRKFE